jgi:hypothetical protein
MILLDKHLEEFKNRIIQNCTDQDGVFYETTATEIVANLSDLAFCSNNSIDFFTDENIVKICKAFISDPNILDENGKVNIDKVVEIIDVQLGLDLSKIPFFKQIVKTLTK